MYRSSIIAAGFALALCLAPGTVSAQTQNVIYADNDPNPASGVGNAFPFGAVGIRYQAIFPHSVFGSRSLNIATITDILLAGNTSDFECVYEDIEIRMGITTVTTPLNNWQTNNPNPTTVYRGPLRIRLVATPSPRWGGIGLPNSYLYLPLSRSENLCVEVIVWRASRHANLFYYPKAGSGLVRAFVPQWVLNQSLPPLTSTFGCRMAFVLNDGNIAFAGVGCTSSANTTLSMAAQPGWPQTGKPLTLSLSGARGPSTAWLLLGPALKPVDLAMFGAPGCVLWNDALIPVPTVTSSSGLASFTATVPKGIGPGTIYAHWLVVDPRANAAQLTTSDYATILVAR